jgi:Na+-translocating ferredoxin:NAD+ oxidoreductase RnfC subunit
MMTSENIVESVRNAGVVGAGGAGFPTHVKISAKNIDVIIVNGAECEPLLRVDQQLMETHAGELVRGLRAIQSATGAKRAVFALKGKHKRAVEVLKEEVAEQEGLQVFIIEDFYPAGDEQVLVYEVTGKVVPEGGIPLMVGAVVVNVETLLNISKAIDGLPVTRTYVTVGGRVERPVTLRLPIGISIREALELAGGIPEDGEYSIIEGGPMMGKLVANMETPITKTTKGLLLLENTHPLIAKKSASLSIEVGRAMSACCQCRFCTDLCPRHLLGHSIEPHKTLRSVSYGVTSDVDSITRAFLCSECGVCDLFACTMGLSPKKVNMEIKRAFTAQGFKNPHRNTELSANAMRDFRKIPVKRLVYRLGLADVDRPAPLAEEEYQPQRVVIPLRQHVGAPALSTVEVGQEVREGDLIGRIPQDALGAQIHASISGRVQEVTHGAVTILSLSKGGKA